MKSLLLFVACFLVMVSAFAQDVAVAEAPVSMFSAIVLALLAISEVLALTKLKSSSILTLVANILKTLSGKKD